MDSPQPQRAAKPYKGVAFVLSAAVVILLTGYLLFLWATGSLLPPMSEAQARKFVQEAGGADEISREAAGIIRSFETSEADTVKAISIFDSTITNFPAISVLLTNSSTRGALIDPHRHELPSYIRIMYGPHMHLKFMSIFYETNGLDQHFLDSHIQLSSNIFFSK